MYTIDFRKSFRAIYRINEYMSNTSLLTRFERPAEGEWIAGHGLRTGTDWRQAA